MHAVRSADLPNRTTADIECLRDVIYEIRNVIAYPLTILFNKCLEKYQLYGNVLIYLPSTKREGKTMLVIIDQ